MAELVFVFFFFKQKTAYEMRISDWSSDVCSSDLGGDNLGDLDLTPAQEAAVSDAVSADRSGPLPEDPNLFVHVYNPPLRLLIVGAVHISQALVPIASLAGYEVVVIDPRKAWASAERFPGVRLEIGRAHV